MGLGCIEAAGRCKQAAARSHSPPRHIDTQYLVVAVVVVVGCCRLVAVVVVAGCCRWEVGGCRTPPHIHTLEAVHCCSQAEGELPPQPQQEVVRRGQGAARSPARGVVQLQQELHSLSLVASDSEPL